MLAIIIPYYKITFFKETLDSLANQTDKRFKVYVGDDASLENCSVLLENYRGNFEFEYYRFENNLGKSSLTMQWQRCIALCSDEQWMMILGDDDVLGATVVEQFYNNIKEVEQRGIHVIRFASQKMDEVGTLTSKIYEHPKIERAVQFLFDKTRSSLSEYVFRKSQVLEIGFKDFPLAWYSDFLAVLEFSNFDTIYTINNSIVYVRLSELSISGSTWNKDQKIQANFEFYYYLVKNKYSHFSEMELNELYYMLNKCYINNKKQYLFFFKILKLYFLKNNNKENILFVKQIIYYTIKNRIKI
ncbi:glycosyl transferase [Flavobacterium palustre]|uniref:Glycosyl transferase n=1 Tax=Flavobacterium palustre TaxID=1476463 RepID=A0ABQ1HU19_9FLAO|nr:glycosyltransferase [Flavobacterium palustre]GGA88924.1 glycosyl transferase [Flavobacterium palustre]